MRFDGVDSLSRRPLRVKPNVESYHAKALKENAYSKGGQTRDSAIQKSPMGNTLISKRYSNDKGSITVSSDKERQVLSAALHQLKENYTELRKLAKGFQHIKCQNFAVSIEGSSNNREGQFPQEYEIVYIEPFNQEFKNDSLKSLCDNSLRELTKILENLGEGFINEDQANVDLKKYFSEVIRSEEDF